MLPHSASAYFHHLAHFTVLFLAATYCWDVLYVCSYLPLLSFIAAHLMIHSLNPDLWKRDLVVIGSVLFEYSLAGYLGSKRGKQEEGRHFLSDGFCFCFMDFVSTFFGDVQFFSASFDYVEDYLPGLSGPWTYSKSRQTRFGYRLSLGSAICSFDHRLSDLGFGFSVFGFLLSDFFFLSSILTLGLVWILRDSLWISPTELSPRRVKTAVAPIFHTFTIVIVDG
jgi:hypothetical protein